MLEVMGRVKNIQIRPLKGGDSIDFDVVRMTQEGIESLDGVVVDHQFVALREEPGLRGFHHFLSQRTQIDPKKNLYIKGEPKLALVKPAYDETTNKLTFGWKESLKEKVEVPQEHDPELVLPIQVWEHWGGAIEIPLLSEWLSDQLERNVLVAKTGVYPWTRRARQNFMTNNNTLRTQDGYPVHAVSSTDSQDVFGAIDAEDDPKRFRYQVLLEGIPFREIHDFAEGEINGVKVLQAKPCDRCEVTGIDQNTGESSKIKPLAGIVKAGGTRWIRPDNGNKVHIMGENWLPQGEAIIIVGDPVIFTRLRETPLQFEETKRS